MMRAFRKANWCHLSSIPGGYLNIIRNVRGHGRRSYFEVPDKTVASSAPIQTPTRVNPSTFGLTESKMSELARSLPSLMQNTRPQTSERVPVPEQTPVEPVTVENQYEEIARSVTPYWKMDYKAQLQIKQEKAEHVLKMLKTRLVDVGVGHLPAQHSYMPCPLQPIIASPTLEQYRNKDEFMVYRGVDGDPKTVGFLTGHPKLESTVCVPPTHLITIRDQHKALCSHFELFIRSSRHNTNLHFRDSPGVWRSITARSNTRGELMAIVVIHPHTLNQEEITEIESDLKQYFFSGAGAELGLTSLYLQVCENSRCTRQQSPYKLLQGNPYITESSHGMDFQISPDTFFQANPAGAERLYSCVQQVAELTSLTTLLDVCCGTGSICLLMAGQVRGVVGVESVSSAVEDANRNAKLNNINNVTFIPGAPEKVLPQLSNELAGCTDLVAVLNPGRGGVPPQVITSLRHNLGVSKLIYLSCRPEGYALSNFVSFGNMIRPKNKRAPPPPLLPRYAFTVDMFPHTSHYEMGVLFVREEAE